MSRKKPPTQPLLDERSKLIQAGLKTYAPTKTFGGVTEPVYSAKRQSVATKRAELQDAKDEVERLRIELQNEELDLWDVSGKVINGVIGDVEFGPDSALYGSFGLVRTSERKSGLTRKRKDGPLQKRVAAIALPTLQPLELSGANGNGHH